MAEKEVWFEARIGLAGGYLPVHWKGWAITGVFIVSVLAIMFSSGWILDHLVGKHAGWMDYALLAPPLLIFWVTAATHCRLPGE